MTCVHESELKYLSVNEGMCMSRVHACMQVGISERNKGIAIMCMSQVRS